MPNAMITCRVCKKQVDKGSPAQEGQNDSLFTCNPCQDVHNAREVAKRLAAEAPTEELKA